MNRDQIKLFLENFLVYGLGGMISKFIPLVMLPVITRLYPSSEYIGLNDLSTTFISLASALAVCGMYDAMFRLFFDKEGIEGQKAVCSTALIFVAASSIFLTVLCLTFRDFVADFYFGGEKYEYLVVITVLGFLLTSTNQIISAPTRIQNKRKVFLVTNTISPLISYSVAIPLILEGYYIISMPLATIISGLTIGISFSILNKKYFQLNMFNKQILKDLMKIGIPLLPNFIVYWIYNSADKVMITQLIGTSYTGIYSVASRIGHISNLIYIAFSGGWLYFAYSTMNNEDQVQLKSDLFEYLGAISFACTVLVMGFSKIGFRILFTNEYIQGYITVPYLFLSPLLLMLYQVIANQFTIVKKTYLNLLALSIGAILNLALNYLLINAIGIEGASIATVSGYIVSISVCILLLRRQNLIHINKNVYINIAIIAAFYLVWRLTLCELVIPSAVMALIATLVYLYIYKDLLFKFIKERK